MRRKFVGAFCTFVMVSTLSVPESVIAAGGDTPKATVGCPASDQVVQTSDVQVLYRVKTRDKVVFITIDDGALVTPQLAKVIDKYKIPITTFAMPEMLWRSQKWYLARKNMTFENHTNTHAHMTLVRAKRRMEEIAEANKKIQRITGEFPRFFRPPRGSWNKNVKATLATCGMKYIIMWSKVITNTGVRRNYLQRGDIILLHYVESLPGALENLMKVLKDEGLEPALLRDYLE